MLVNTTAGQKEDNDKNTQYLTGKCMVKAANKGVQTQVYILCTGGLSVFESGGVYPLAAIIGHHYQFTQHNISNGWRGGNVACVTMHFRTHT